jgi:excisionase family DNA binding protein
MRKSKALPEALALPVEDVARALALTRRSIIKMIDLGEIRAIRVGSALRIPRSELDRILAGNARKEQP